MFRRVIHTVLPRLRTQLECVDPSAWFVTRHSRAHFLSAGAILLIASACAPLAPYRVHEKDIECHPAYTEDDPKSEQFGAVSEACADAVLETNPPAAAGKGYVLHFVEFDDQGRLFPGTPANDLAPLQIEHFLDSIRGAGTADASEPTSVVVFVHGWKHGTRSDDSNVRWFRAMLDKLALVESKSSCPRKVIGLYVGWRGDATTLPEFAKNTTFWSRKRAANRVANGQVRELFGRLRSIQDIRNDSWNNLVKDSERAPDAAETLAKIDTCYKAMRLTIVGHSFGGLIVYNALSPSLIRDIADLNERIRNAPPSVRDPVLAREGDLIVTINPAVEAAAFAPLWLAAQSALPKSYHSPVFVSITSADDDATGIAFPLARSFSTIFNKYPEGDEYERRASRESMGHDLDLVDYELGLVNAPSARVVPDAVCERIRDAKFGERFAAEMERLETFSAALEANPDANTQALVFPRQYCVHPQDADGNAAIVLQKRRSVNLNSPVWNVRTRTPILDDHSDLLNRNLVDFLRQLYEEGTRRESSQAPSTGVAIPSSVMDANVSGRVRVGGGP